VVRYNRGRAYALLGDMTEALASFDEAIRLDPRFARAYEARAEVHARRGDFARARADREVAARGRPSGTGPAASSPAAVTQ
jgi:tetratricopeptide (TPR) repeat protein